MDGGGRGIRTPGTLSSTAVFKTACFNRSHIPPHEPTSFFSLLYDHLFFGSSFLCRTFVAQTLLELVHRCS